MKSFLAERPLLLTEAKKVSLLQLSPAPLNLIRLTPPLHQKNISEKSSEQRELQLLLQKIIAYSNYLCIDFLVHGLWNVEHAIFPILQYSTKAELVILFHKIDELKLWPQRLLTYNLSAFWLFIEGDYMHALKLVFDSQSLMIRFKEEKKYEYVDHHLAANMITFLIFWTLEEYDSALKYAASCRRLLKRIMNKKEGSGLIQTSEAVEEAKTERETTFITEQENAEQAERSNTLISTTSGYMLAGYPSKFTQQNQLNILALVEMALAQCKFQLRPAWVEFESCYKKIKQVLSQLEGEIGGEEEVPGYRLLLRYFKSMALKRQQTQNYRSRERQKSERNAFTAPPQKKRGLSPPSSDRQIDSPHAESPRERSIPAQIVSQLRDEFIQGQMDPFSWKETIDCLSLNLFLPFKDEKNALNLREEEYTRALRKKKKEKSKESEQDLAEGVTSIRRYFQQFRKKKNKFERLHKSPNREALEREKQNSLSTWFWQDQATRKATKNENLRINNNDLRLGTSTTIVEETRETEMSQQPKHRHVLSKNKKLGQIYDAYERRMVDGVSIDRPSRPLVAQSLDTSLQATWGKRISQTPMTNSSAANNDLKLHSVGRSIQNVKRKNSQCSVSSRNSEIRSQPRLRKFEPRDEKNPQQMKVVRLSRSPAFYCNSSRVKLTEMTGQYLRSERKLLNIIADCSRQLKNVNSVLMNDYQEDSQPSPRIYKGNRIPTFSSRTLRDSLEERPEDIPKKIENIVQEVAYDPLTMMENKRLEQIDTEEHQRSERINEIIRNPSHRFEVLDSHPKIAHDIDNAIQRYTQGGFQHQRRTEQMRKQMLTSFFSTQDLASIRELTPLERRQKNMNETSRPKGILIKNPLSASFVRSSHSPQLPQLSYEGSRFNGGKNASRAGLMSAHSVKRDETHSKIKETGLPPRFNNTDKRVPSTSAKNRMKLADALSFPLRRDGRSQFNQTASTPQSDLRNSFSSSQNVNSKMRSPPLMFSSLDQFKRADQIISPAQQRTPSTLGSRVSIIPGQRLFKPLRQERATVNKSLSEVEGIKHGKLSTLENTGLRHSIEVKQN